MLTAAAEAVRPEPLKTQAANALARRVTSRSSSALFAEGEPTQKGDHPGRCTRSGCPYPEEQPTHGMRHFGACSTK
jgi:hypothetical protein